jgi:hypothetical protein
MYTESILRYLVTHKKLNKTMTIVMDKLLSEIYAVGKYDLKCTRELVILSKWPISDELKGKH